MTDTPQASPMDELKDVRNALVGLMHIRTVVYAETESGRITVGDLYESCFMNAEEALDILDKLIAANTTNAGESGDSLDGGRATFNSSTPAPPTPAVDDAGLVEQTARALAQYVANNHGTHGIEDVAAFRKQYVEDNWRAHVDQAKFLLQRNASLPTARQGVDYLEYKDALITQLSEYAEANTDPNRPITSWRNLFAEIIDKFGNHLRTPPNAASVREGFEQKARFSYNLIRRNDGNYEDLYAQAAWHGYQAGQAASGVGELAAALGDAINFAELIKTTFQHTPKEIPMLIDSHFEQLANRIKLWKGVLAKARTDSEAA